MLTLKYEDLVESKKEVIRNSSKFLHTQIIDEIIDLVIQNTTFDFMKRNEKNCAE
jgi:hypothetical protein